MNKVLTLPLLVLALIYEANSQATGRFVLNVVDSAMSNNVRCLGAAITNRHVLVPASCVDGVEHVSVEIRITGRTTRFVLAERIFPYPQFNRAQTRGNNVAVILLRSDDRFDSNFFTPRALSSLRNDTDCRLFGWSDDAINPPRTETIRVQNPSDCDPSLPRAFCTRFEAISPACAAIPGAPVVCGEGSIVSGFLVGTDRECFNVGGRFELFYHSVGNFQQWIEEVSSAGKTGPMSIFFMLSAVIMTLKNVL